MREMEATWVQSLGSEDPLEKEMTPHSTILAWEIPWMRDLVGHSLWGCRGKHDRATALTAYQGVIIS